jgi:predicted CoA-binding protein
MASINDPGEIEKVLGSARTIAVVGCSPNPVRPSHSIARYLIGAGYDVIPVNPGHAELLGRRCYPDLASIPADVTLDIVDVFRRSEFVAGLADAALARGKGRVGFFWMQDGVFDEEAAKKLNEKGIGVAMDRCIYRDRETLFSAIGGR